MHSVLKNHKLDDIRETGDFASAHVSSLQAYEKQGVLDGYAYSHIWGIRIEVSSKAKF
jgi:hypothetical protein